MFGVVGGSGGVGASTFAAVLAAVTARAMLVDIDVVGGGIDVLLGIEDVPGARWSGLRVGGGRLDPGSLADGKYTGEIGRYAYGPEKAIAIRELAEERGYDLAGSYAYSDSVTDVPMLEAVGHPFAVNADRALRRIAAERDWPTLTFSNAVPLRERISGLRPEHPTATATVVGAGVAVLGLVWYASRRRVRRA